MEDTACQSHDQALEDVECFCADEELMALSGGCEKNPGHMNYIKMADLSLESLPNRIKDICVLRTLQLCSALVVRVVVNVVSPLRPKTDPFYCFVGTKTRLTASGYVRAVVHPSSCAIPNCHECRLGKHGGYGEVDVVTNKHVIYDDIEAAATTIELFYDSFSRDEVKCLKGLRVINSSEFLDVSHVTCASDDADLIHRLLKCKSDVADSLAIIPRHISASGMCVAISHPHGMPKVVSFGDIIEQDVPEYGLTDNIWAWHLGRMETEKRQSRARSAEFTSKTTSKHGVRTVARCRDSEEPENIELVQPKKEGMRMMCRYVSRYLVATCRGSSGGPIFVQFGASRRRLDCFIHSRYDKVRKMNLSRRKNIF